MLKTQCSEMMCINVKNTTQRNVYECYTPNAVKCCILMLKTLRSEMYMNVINYAVKCCVLMLKTLRSEMLCINVKNTTH